MIGVAIGIPRPWGPVLDAHRLASGDPLAPYIPAHVTLLGPTVITAPLSEVDEHLIGVAGVCPSFTIKLAGTDTFRPVTQVVFVALKGGMGECSMLAAAVRSGPLERELLYPYHPHVTVAHDVPEAALDAVFAELADFEAEFDVNSFTLYEHGTDGHWHPLRTYQLTGPV